MRRLQVPARFSRQDLRPDLSRRAWLARAAAGLTGLGLMPQLARARQDGDDPTEEAKEIARVKAVARQANLGAFGENRVPHFLGLGDAEAKYCEQAILICEPLSDAFLAEFRKLGFKVALPRERMTVITLKNKASYDAYCGVVAGDEVGGHFDLETNHLVVFDFRSKRAELAATAERVNTFTLVHEGMHLLSYNSGLLDRKQDVPAAIAEGLATYGELWRPRSKGKMGTVNQPRLKALTDAGNADAHWIPIADLLADDAFFQKNETAQLAYAESWLLVNYLLKRDSPQLARFRAYLASIPARGNESDRKKIAEAALGPLEKLDREVFKSANKLVRKAR